VTVATGRMARDGASRRDLADGLVHHRAGRLATAAACYHRVLAVAPDDPDANHLVGLIALGAGEVAAAAGHFERVVRARPRVAEYRSNLGHALRTLGDLAAADRALAEAVRVDPGCIDGWINLGLTRLDLGDLEGAVRALETAVGRAPTSALAQLNLGIAYQRAGRLALALERFREASRLAPDLAAAHRCLGVVAHLEGQIDEAIRAYRRAVALVPEDADAWTNLGVILVDVGAFEDALAAHDTAVAAAPRLAEAWLNRGTALQSLGRLSEAGESFEQAARLGAEPQASTALGSLAAELGAFSQAIACHERAIAGRADFADGHWNLALALLGAGDLERGWDEYEWRWRASTRPASFRDYPWPVWSGELVAGRRLLIWREQGLGDELLFLSCLPDLVAAGAAVTALVTPRLVSLTARAFPEVVVVGDEPDAVGRESSFDWHTPLGSLPRWLRRSRASFPGTGYLAPSAAARATWAARMAELPPGPRVGVCWRSGLATAARARHYAPLAAWEPLWTVPGIVWVNLQYDECAAEVAAIKESFGVELHRWPAMDLKNDLEGVVGLVAALDAVVTAPTAVGAVAGAVGTPTWQVESGSDWSLFGADRSPWFSEVAVVRKGPGPDGWGVALTTVAERVRAWVETSAS